MQRPIAGGKFACYTVLSQQLLRVCPRVQASMQSYCSFTHTSMTHNAGQECFVCYTNCTGAVAHAVYNIMMHVVFT